MYSRFGPRTSPSSRMSIIGKTTLIDVLLRSSGSFRTGQIAGAHRIQRDKPGAHRPLPGAGNRRAIAAPR
jgi:hypothetical protein